MERTDQSQANHTRWHAPFHFFLIPVLAMHLISSGVRAWRNPEWVSLEGLLLAAALVVMGFLTRINPLRAQDRLIRLEEQLRFQRVLPAGLTAKAIGGLKESQWVALRFASDGELAGLVEKVLAGSPSKPADIKTAIKSWRGDYFRV
jgi:hypothetical protein